MITSKIDKIKGYIGLCKRAGYLIWGVDNLKGYTHKMYLVIYRNDLSKTLQKALNGIDNKIPKIELSIDEFNEIMQTNNSKIVVIKNMGLSNKIIEIFRGEDV